MQQVRHWQSALKAHWGIEADLFRLDGEYDLNFIARLDDEAGYILKVMRPGCEVGLVDMQIKAFEHIAHRHAHFPCPKVIPSTDQKQLLTLADETGAERLVWLMNLLPGQCYADVAPQSDALIHQIGQVLGGSAVALADFDHDGLDRDFKWNLMMADWVNDAKDCITDPARRQIIDGIEVAFAAVRPALDTLPQQAIHNDANDYNI
ncbi:MAG: peptidase M23, partial [Planktomarina sp.]